MRAHIARPGRARRSGTAPARARVLAVVSSPPLSVMLRLMDVPSDDLFAELFAKQLGSRFGSGGTIAAGAQVISQHDRHRVRDAPEDRRRLRACRARTAPRRAQVVDLLRSACGHRRRPRRWPPRCRSSASTAPCARSRSTPPAQGNCIAKTGTLDYVTNLAGYCQRPAITSWRSR